MITRMLGGLGAFLLALVDGLLLVLVGVALRHDVLLFLLLAAVELGVAVKLRFALGTAVVGVLVAHSIILTSSIINFFKNNQISLAYVNDSNVTGINIHPPNYSILQSVHFLRCILFFLLCWSWALNESLLIFSL
jgi:hypothetical protein